MAGYSPMFTIGALFFIFGFVTWLNGPLIAFVKLAFELDDLNAFLILMAFYLSYFFLALPSAVVLRAIGMKRGMALGLLIMALGAGVFGQFTTARIYGGALAGLFLIGAGLALLQTASNPYVSILGPIERAAQRIAVMGICNKLAGILAPMVFGVLVLSEFDDFETRVQRAETVEARDHLLGQFAAQVYTPYLLMAALLVLLAVTILRSRLPDLRPEAVNADVCGDEGMRSIFSYPSLWLGVVAIFLYVGVEVLAGDAIVVYGQGFGLPLPITSRLTSATLAAMLAGYIAGLILVPRFFSQERYLAISAALAIVLAASAYTTTGVVSVACIALMGFANAMMWPAIFPIAIRGLGRHTEFGSACLVMAIAGGAILPYAFALLKLVVDFQLAYLILALPAYAFILAFGLYGARAARAANLDVRRADMV
jgi:glucose/galactose transporter